MLSWRLSNAWRKRLGGLMKNDKSNIGRQAFRYAFPLTVPICAGFLFLGISYGLYATDQGLPWYLPVLMSALIYAGSMEFVTVALLVSPFDPLGAFVLALMVNARHIFYGLTMITKYMPLGWKRWPVIFGMCDETFAINATCSLPPEIDRGWFYLHVTWLNYLYWVMGAFIGAVGSQFITFNLKGIEFVLAALFGVLFLDYLLKSDKKQYGIIGLVISAGSLLYFGPNYFMVPAMLMMLVVFIGMYFYKGKAVDES